jgi:hypothetical protein
MSKRERRTAAELAAMADGVHLPKRHEHGVRMTFLSPSGYPAGTWMPSSSPEEARQFFDRQVAWEQDRSEAAAASRMTIELFEFGAATRTFTAPTAEPC